MSESSSSGSPDRIEIISSSGQPPDRRARSFDENIEHEEIHTRDPAGFERHESVVRDTAGVEHHEQELRNRTAERMLALTKANQLVWLFVGLIDGLIAVRFVLRLIGANPQNSFASLVYDLSALFLAPFFTLTASPSAGRVVLEIPALIAMIVYVLLGWVIVRIIWLVFAPTASRSHTTYDRFRS